MLRWRKRLIKFTYLFTDIFCLLSSFLIAKILFETIQSHELALNGFERIAYVMLFTFFLMIMYLMLNVFDYTIEEFGSISPKTFVKMTLSFLMTEVFMGAMLFYMHVPLSRTFIVIYGSIVVCLTIVNRIILKQFHKKRLVNKNSRNILVFGQSKRGIKYIEEIKKHNYLNFNLVGYVSIKKNRSYKGLETIGTINDLNQIVIDYVIDEIAVASPLSYDERLPDLLEECQDMGITITMLLQTQNKNAKAQVAMVGDLPVLKFHTVSLNENQLFVKRMLDVVGGSVGMIIFSLVYVILGPLIKLETPGPIIFKQDRVGKNGRVFQVWKFRSMGVNAEKEKAALMANNEMTGHMFKMTNDPRVTRIGEFIRKTSIDELPQFYNVIKGDMSLVGTRPPTVNEVKAYETHHRRRISIMPGITGNWQVSGRSDVEDFEEVVRLDSDYIKDWSVWKDIKILLKTVLVVLKRDGSK